MARDELLNDVAFLLDARGQEYGPADQSFRAIAQIWSALLSVEISPGNVARCMIALKLVRLSSTPTHLDSWRDIAGYAILGGEMAAPKKDVR